MLTTSGAFAQLHRASNLLGFAALIVSMFVCCETLKAFGWDRAGNATRPRAIG
jgi:hypothetical protein